MSTNKQELDKLFLEMKKYKISKRSVLASLEWSKNEFLKLQSGEHRITRKKLDAIHGEIERQKKEWKDTQEAVNETILSNIVNLRDKHISTVVSEFGIARDTTSPTLNALELRQKIKRNSREFEPSIEPSIDMITLTKKLSKVEEEVLLASISDFVETDPRFKGENREKTYKVVMMEYQYFYAFDGDDVKVVMHYNFWDRKNNVDSRMLKVKFNPNKWHGDNEFLKILILILGHDPCVYDYDVCKDFKDYKHSNVYEATHKNKRVQTDGQAVKTVYFGNKARKTLNLMIYDKREEVLKKDSKDIGFDCVRVETRIFVKSKNQFGISSGISEYRPPKILYAAMLVEFKSIGSAPLCSPKNILMYEDFLVGGKKYNWKDKNNILFKRRLEDKIIKKSDVCWISQHDVIMALNKFKVMYDYAYNEYLPHITDILEFPNECIKRVDKQRLKSWRKETYEYYKEYLAQHEIAKKVIESSIEEIEEQFIETRKLELESKRAETKVKVDEKKVLEYDALEKEHYELVERYAELQNEHKKIQKESLFELVKSEVNWNNI